MAACISDKKMQHTAMLGKTNTWFMNISIPVFTDSLELGCVL